MTNKILAALLLTGVLATGLAYGNGGTPAYDGTAVRISPGPNDKQYSRRFSYDGSGRVEYIGYAARNQPEYAWTIASGRLVSIVVVSNTATVTTSTAHGLTSSGASVTISGVTGDTDLNNTYYLQTTPTATTFTVTVASVAAATYSNSGISVTTTAPRGTDGIWLIEKYLYDGSGNITDILTSMFSQIWDNRAVTTGTTRTTYQ